jgi:3-oxoacyl-[acyl-carrier protein] reductase
LKDFAMTRLAGKVALVSGASHGIGAGIARRFGAEGAAVVVHHTDDAQGAARVVADIVWRGGRAIAVHGDIAHWPDIRRLFEETLGTFGGLDILVNNAGPAKPMAMRAMSGAERARQAELQAEAMLFGAMLMSQEAVRLFGADGGSIINLAPDAATDAMTLGLSRALGALPISVHALAPDGCDAIGALGDTASKRAVALACNDNGWPGAASSEQMHHGSFTRH